MSDIDSEHGDGLVVPDGWTWTLVDVTCDACGFVNQLHEQPPEWLETEHGVKWECNNCSAVNTLGGVPEKTPALFVLECGHCSSTFDPNTVDVSDDGEWTCPSCEVPNRFVQWAEYARGSNSEVMG